MSTVAQSLQKVLKKRAQKLREETQQETPTQETPTLTTTSLITPVQKRNYEFSVNIVPPSSGNRKIQFKFRAYLSRNEKNAMDELISEIITNFVNNYESNSAILDRTEKLSKLLQSKINDYSKDFLEALDKLFSGINKAEVGDNKGIFILTKNTGGKGKKAGTEVFKTNSIYESIEKLIKNKLKRIELEQEPEIFESIEEEQPEIVQPSFIETKPTFQTPDIKFVMPQTIVEAKQRAIERALERGRKKIIIRKAAKKLQEKAEQERLAREAKAEAERLEAEAKKQAKKLKESKVVQQETPEIPTEFFGEGLNKTHKLEDIFGQLNPKVLAGKGTKVSPKKLLTALLGDGHKIKKVAKPTDARRVRGQKVRELMEKEGLTLAQASKKLKMMG